MTARSSHWQHATYTHFTELAFPRELPRAHGDAIAASLDSTGREDEVLRSLRLTAVLRTLDSRSPSPLHVVKLQANCKPAFFFFFYMWVTPVNSGVRNWSPKPKTKQNNTKRTNMDDTDNSMWKFVMVAVKGVAAAAISIHQLSSPSVYCKAALWCHDSLGDPTMWRANWKVIACAALSGNGNVGSCLRQTKLFPKFY